MAFTFHRIPAAIDNCYLLRGGQNVLVDGGAPGGFEEFRRGLERLGIAPQDIHLIILTHAHADHIAALHEIKALTGAPVAVHESERTWVEEGRPPLPPGQTTWGKVMIALAKKLYRPAIRPVQVDIAFGDEGFSLTEYGIPGRVIHTPGHSPGSSTVLLEGGEAFVGDMAMNAWFLRLTPGLPILAEDMDRVIASWGMLIEQGARRVYPAHGEDFDVEVIRREIARRIG
ncbi:MAG: MBL fold metallo-hydrolase [Anaerolineae bacterium]|nr:MAG: MBL fold metallo-hydrolase [Anaerolineae bacterium]